MGEHELEGDTGVCSLPWSMQRLLCFERFHLHVNDTLLHKQPDESFDIKYLPENCKSFVLPCFEVRRRDLRVFEVSEGYLQGIGLSEGSTPDNTILFPVHPLSLKHYEKFLRTVGACEVEISGGPLLAVATSSVRTLLAWPQQAPERAFFVKTTMLPSPLFGDRRVLTADIAHGVGLTKALLQSSTFLPVGMTYLPESAGFAPKSLPDSGVIIRAIPEEVRYGRTCMAPLFALIGGSGKHQPLLLTWMQMHGIEPRQFVEEVLCARFARLWLETSMCFGVMPEAHGQNVLIAISGELAPVGKFYYRDFDTLLVDWGVRQARGFRSPPNMPFFGTWYDTYCTERVWGKYYVSLYAYLHFFLNEVGVKLGEWQRFGLIRGDPIRDGELTQSFSSEIMSAAADMFGVRRPERYDIYRSLKKFSKFLLEVRRVANRSTVYRSGAIPHWVAAD